MDDATLAAELVRDAGQLAKRMLAEGLRTDYKTSISDVVSAADHAAEDLITGRLAAARPDDGLIGEEGSRRPGDDRRWYVDPVDGTYNFLNGVPYWCSAVGLSDSDGPLVGAVYYPSVDELWVGGEGLPTSRNGEPVARLTDRALSSIAVCTYAHPTNLDDLPRQRCWQAVVSRAATVRMMGSASIDLASVATGRLGLFLQSDLNDWDWVPGAALVRGAGGEATVTHAGGHRWHVAGNAQAVAEAVTALDEAG
ncbi:MAG TPA: inositol monophosphatase [Microlunatus sp.]|nr:inositol monophosphatase [Microlunatus sp.]